MKISEVTQLDELLPGKEDRPDMRDQAKEIKANWSKYISMNKLESPTTDDFLLFVDKLGVDTQYVEKLVGKTVADAKASKGTLDTDTLGGAFDNAINMVKSLSPRALRQGKPVPQQSYADVQNMMKKAAVNKDWVIQAANWITKAGQSGYDVSRLQKDLLNIVSKNKNVMQDVHSEDSVTEETVPVDASNIDKLAMAAAKGVEKEKTNTLGAFLSGYQDPLGIKKFKAGIRQKRTDYEQDRDQRSF